MLLPSLTTCARPGSSPTKNTLPKVETIGSIRSYTGRGQDVITASVPFSAPVTPPLTGLSTHCTPWPESPSATRLAVPGPVVDRSSMISIALPPPSPSGPSATFSTTSGVGRLVSTTGTASATSRGDPAARAPRATAASTAAPLVS